MQRIGLSLSGAEVHRVETGGKRYVLKLARADQPLLPWRGRLHVQQLAANAGLAPRVVHADEMRRAIVSESIADQSFLRWFGNPRSRDAALGQLGQLLRRVHQLPAPASLEAQSPRDLLAAVSAALGTRNVPAFALEGIRAMLAVAVPAAEPPVLSHNDVHPANLLYDGERLLLVDWDATAPNDPHFDLGTIALFLQLDDDACGKLLTAYAGKPVTSPPPSFRYQRRLAGVLCGASFLQRARERGHLGAADTPPPTLADVYAQLRTGALNLEEPAGHWTFGLALIHAANSAT